MNPAEPNRIGIIGAGRLGQAMARTALHAGRSAVIANSRGRESVTSIVSAFGDGISAGPVDEASEFFEAEGCAPRLTSSLLCKRREHANALGDRTVRRSSSYEGQPASGRRIFG
jgi:hypothetical protein